jgi:hypothetical protein
MPFGTFSPNIMPICPTRQTHGKYLLPTLSPGTTISSLQATQVNSVWVLSVPHSGFGHVLISTTTYGPGSIIAPKTHSTCISTCLNSSCILIVQLAAAITHLEGPSSLLNTDATQPRGHQPHPNSNSGPIAPPWSHGWASKVSPKKLGGQALVCVWAALLK